MLSIMHMRTATNSFVMRRALRSCAHGPDGAGRLHAACAAGSACFVLSATHASCQAGVGVLMKGAVRHGH